MDFSDCLLYLGGVVLLLFVVVDALGYVVFGLFGFMFVRCFFLSASYAVF